MPAVATPTAPSTANDPKAKAQEAVRKISTIATLPEVTARIVATVEDPRSTASQLHKIIAHDPALVTRILKVVNSSFYGLPGQIGSVERAIVLLGLNAVKNIAVAASLGQLFRGAKLCEGYTAKDLWTHCIAVAVAAREMARQMKAPIADEAFLAGMIHDIGMLVSLQLWPEPLREVCEIVQRDGRAFREVELEKFGTDHQYLGQALTEQWRFPRPCQLVAGYHHDPATLGDDNRLLVSLVHAADVICCQSKHGFTLTAKHQTLTDAASGAGAVDPLIAAKVAEQLDALVESASPMLG
jgi:HD-like signal output (HDOD) protein